MASGSASYHEPFELVSSEAKELHRAIVSAQEELEAVDWYRQRADACRDEQLRQILLHNMNEEIEHFAMVLEWLRRNSPHFDEQLRTYLFTDGNILEAEEEAMDRNGDSAGQGGKADGGGMTIGKLKE